MGKPFWERTYSDPTAATFGKNPSNDILKISPSLRQGMTILDIGCGEGRNSIYLAGLGHRVDAFDVSEAGISKLKRIAGEKHIAVNVWVQDLTTFEFNKTYDLIISHGVLHLVEKHDWQRMTGMSSSSMLLFSKMNIPGKSGIGMPPTTSLL